jgi:peptidoglycan/LPS O-acetylase OafA/YrhL
MKRKIPLLRGLAILAVIMCHAAARAVDDLMPARGSALALHGWTLVQYRALTAAMQLSYFAVPAFFFIAGVFAAYATRGTSLAANWPFLKRRLSSLLLPLAFWSVVVVLVDAVLGVQNWAAYCYDALKAGGTGWGYFFVLALAQFYLLTPWFVHVSAAHPRRVLLAIVTVHLVVVCLRVVGGLAPDSFFAAIPGIGSWQGNEVPWRWLLYFGLGVLASPRSGVVEEWLKKHRRAVGTGAFFFTVLALLEGALLADTYRNVEWILSQHRFAVSLAVVFALAYFFSLDINPTTLSRWIERAGAQSFGIFLTHSILHKGVYRILLHFSPTLCRLQPLVVTAICFVFGLSVPWLTIEAMSRSRYRATAVHIFGQ